MTGLPHHASVELKVIRFLGEWGHADRRGCASASTDDLLAEIELRYPIADDRTRRMSLKAVVRDDGKPAIRVEFFETEPGYIPVLGA